MLARIPSSSLLLVLVACGGAIDPDETKQTDQAVDGRSSHEKEEEKPAAQEEEQPPPPPKQASDECAVGETHAACTTATGIQGVCECTNGNRSSDCGQVRDQRDSCDPLAPKECSTQPGGGSSSGSSGNGGWKLMETCVLEDGVWQLGHSSCFTPLVLSFDERDDARVSFTHPQGSFDLVGAGASFETDWVSAATPWLGLDRNGNGRIDDGSELFGSMTQLGSRRASNGFEALAALDDNHDGRITEADAAFTRLLLWSDTNQDRASSKSELSSLSDRGLIAIELDYRVEQHCTGTACEVERARFTFADAGRSRTGHVVDVHFAITR